MKGFSVARLPELRFGEGVLDQLPAALLGQARGVLVLVSGGSSLRRSGRLDGLRTALRAGGLRVLEVEAPQEPTVEMVDGAVSRLKMELGAGSAAVVAVGGGSVIDAGKAIAAMLTMDGSVLDYMEVLGTRKPSGTRLPLIVAPTTGGTGSEATKNAVIARTGPGGSKRSIRHDNFVPDAVYIDPGLALSCPPAVTAAAGLDAITQLVEAYTSTGASPFTDALAVEGLALAGRFFERAWSRGDRDIEARAGMALAAYYSGICLANAGLGAVHGIASPLCGMFPVSHGVCCGSLVGEAMAVSVKKAGRMAEAGDDLALAKYGRAGRALTGREAGSPAADAALLVETLESLVDRTGMPRLAAFGLTAPAARQLAAAVNPKTHPVPLSIEEIAGIIERRI